MKTVINHQFVRSLSITGAKRVLTRSTICAVGIAVYGCMQSQPELPFDRVVLDTGHSGDCKAIGDVDGDGKPDLFYGGDVMVWYRNPDWRKTVIATAIEEFTTDCQAADLNNDGRIDIITGDGMDANNVVWFENLGERGWTRHTIGAHGNWVHDVEVADFDGDGYLDVLTHGHGTQLWYQNADSSWSASSLGAADQTLEGVGIGDVDRDGSIDIVQGGWWFRNPGKRARPWVSTQFATGYDGGSYTAIVADLDRDGRPDIALSEQHSPDELAWFSAPPDPYQPNWRKHVLGNLGAHKLNVADVNGDDYADLVVGLELTELRIYVSDGATPPQFAGKTINTTGCHNTRVGDIDGDTRVDILCGNFLGHPPVELWLNRVVAPSEPGGWQYIRIDDSRAKQGSGWPAFGLAFGDIDRDGRVDIVSGRYFYRNPGGRLTGRWKRTTFPVDADAILVMDVDQDGQLDVIAQSLPTLYWLKPDAEGNNWTAHVVAELQPTSHVNSQGFRIAQIVPGDPLPAIVMTTGDGVWAVRVPADAPESSIWPAKRIAEDTAEDLLATADIDGDGLVDIVACSALDGSLIRWHRNPGDWKGDWHGYDVGEVNAWCDRAEIVDIDGDGAPDIAVSTENGNIDGAATYWFRAPVDPKAELWKRNVIAVQGSTNSMDIEKLDGSGHIAIVTGEHKGSLRVRLWHSEDAGQSWHDTVVDTGKESHLGTRFVDLNGDGLLEIVSIAWDGYADLHVWRNDTRLAAPTAE